MNTPRDLLNLLSEREGLQLAESEVNNPNLVDQWKANLTETELQVLDVYDRAVQRWYEMAIEEHQSGRH